MKSVKLILLTAVILSANTAFSQHEMKSGKESKYNATLIPGLGSYHYKISAKNDMAQKFFDQGLTLIYAFNHEEAIKSFKKAASLEPELAMAYWGISYSLGPNYNLPADDNQRKSAYKYLQKAIKHSMHASQKEKDLINALSKRYSSDLKTDQGKLNHDYRVAMKNLHTKYPDDADIATLYAESMMDLKPWQLWDKDGNPSENTEEIVSVLEEVLSKNPMHPGANHYYIHAVEASKNPGRAYKSAQVLKDLTPSAGHLVHMPAHILFRIGDYEGASEANINAINSDESYISKYKPEGIYPVMYYNHNLNFLSVSRMMQGNFSDAIKNAKIIEANTKPVAEQMQMLEIYAANPMMILISFNKWDDLLDYQAPSAGMNTYSALVHFSRGLAFAHKGSLSEANKELSMFVENKNNIKPEDLCGNNPANTVLSVAEKVLNANIKLAEGDTSSAVNILYEAVELENNVSYDEPPDWYPSVRLSLGKLLYSAGRYPEAEKIFRDDLIKYPNNGRALFGLSETLKQSGKNEEAEKCYQDFLKAWEKADTKLTMDTL